MTVTATVGLFDRRHSLRSESRLRRSSVATLAVLATLSPVSGAEAASASPNPSGASASGYAWGTFILGCETCSQLPITLNGNPTPTAGGPGSASASIGYSGGPDVAASGSAFDGYTLRGRVELEAMASFDAGPLQLPLLGARALAVSEQAFSLDSVNPDPVFAGIDSFSAEGRAETRMLYTWLGNEDVTFTFTFEVHGFVEDQRSSIFGSAGFFSADNIEVPLALGAAGSAHLTGAEGYGDDQLELSQPFSISLRFTPGSSAVLYSSLTANVFSEYASGLSFADAMSTMSVSGITGGDTSLLAASPVPLPASALLLLSGLGLLSAGAGRRIQARS